MEDHRSTETMTRFLVIWVGQLFSLIGSTVAGFAVVWWITQETGSATALATATAASILPGVILGPVAGAYVDRWNRRRVMIVADAAIALVSLLMAFLFWRGAIRLWHIYLINAVRAIGGSFHWPAMQASTSLMVPERHLTRVAGMNQTAHGLQNIVGPPLGALLLSLLPIHSVLLIDVATAAIAVMPLLFIPIPQPRRRRDGATARSLWGDVFEGVRYVWQWPGLRIIMGMAMLINFVLFPAESLSPLLITEHFAGGALELGWLNSAWGVGVVVGGMALSVWGGFKRKVYTSLTGLVFMGVGFLLIGVAPAWAFLLAVAGNFLAGAMNPIVNGPFFAILQSSVAPELQGRVFTVIGSLSGGIAPLSLAIAGPVADVVGVRTWYVAGGLTCMILGAIAFRIPALIYLEDDPARFAAAPADDPGLAAEAAEPVATTGTYADRP